MNPELYQKETRDLTRGNKNIGTIKKCKVIEKYGYEWKAGEIRRRSGNSELRGIELISSRKDEDDGIYSGSDNNQ